MWLTLHNQVMITKVPDSNSILCLEHLRVKLDYSEISHATCSKMCLCATVGEFCVRMSLAFKVSPTHLVKVMKCICGNPKLYLQLGFHINASQLGSSSGPKLLIVDERAKFYGVLSVSSASTRQDWSVSRTRNGGWYSNAVKTKEPGFLLWWMNQMTAETAKMSSTLIMTRPDTSALGSAGNN